MSQPLCAFVSPKPANIPCPAYAAAPSKFCPVHRDQDQLSRVVKPRSHDATPTVCMRCHEPIAPGTIQRSTPLGPVHAEYICEPKP